MPKKTKSEECKTKINKERKADESSDSTEKSYYYDDAHGYEIYVPEAEDEDEEEDA
jgi:hypothetical protein